jgi:hypothetical protein
MMHHQGHFEKKWEKKARQGAPSFQYGTFSNDFLLLNVSTLSIRTTPPLPETHCTKKVLCGQLPILEL